MQITLNGAAKTLDREMTVTELLATLDVHPVRVAVELNEEIVPRKNYDERAVTSGDRLEIVTFVGGG